MNALIFDCDGVLAETERHLHLPAFNRAFTEAGIDVHWSEEEYPQKLRLGGGRERMAAELTPRRLAELGLAGDPARAAAFVGRLHARKSEIFAQLLAGGSLPPRPGVIRLTSEALAHGWKVAVASSAAEQSARAVMNRIFDPSVLAALPLFAGDAVAAKKPDPAIYDLAISELGVSKADAIVIEDSRAGLDAALAAGLACVVTVSDLGEVDEFPGAALVVSSLGDPGEPLTVIANRSGITPHGQITLEDLAAIARGRHAER